jgi:hypothetical protein
MTQERRTSRGAIPFAPRDRTDRGTAATARRFLRSQRGRERQRDQGKEKSPALSPREAGEPRGFGRAGARQTGETTRTVLAFNRRREAPFQT